MLRCMSLLMALSGLPGMSESAFGGEADIAPQGRDFRL